MCRAERLARPGAPGLSAAQVDFLEAQVLASVPMPPRARVVRALPAFGVAAALVVAVVLLRPASHDGFGVGELTERGERLKSAPLGVRVSCLRGEAVVGSATAGARQSGDALACARGDLLAFSLTNLDAGEAPRYAFVLGIADDGSRRWFAPFLSSAGAATIEPGALDRVLPIVADTAALAPQEHLTLFVLMSDQPFDGGSIARQLDGAQRSGLGLARLERLPVNVPVQAHIDVAFASASNSGPSR